MRQNSKRLFNDNWTFLRTELDVTPVQAEQQKGDFQPVELPHDWLIYDAGNLYRDGTGWYRKTFELTLKEGEQAILRFDGVYMDVTVYVNGRSVGDWKYGYSTFDMNITKALQTGENVVLVQVRHRAPNSRWYSGAGIYRNVYLVIHPETYLPLDGTYVTIRKCDGGFVLEAETEVAGIACLPDRRWGCRYRLWRQGKPVYDLGWYPVEKAEKQEPVETDYRVLAKTVVANPEVWDVENPVCYELHVDLLEISEDAAQDITDSQVITVGFRTIELTTDKGLFLNGRHLKVHGVCEHHDLGCLGSAFHVAAMERKMDMLRTMGVNAIRTSHNMPAPELMELADRKGFLILSEGFDMWERCKTEYDYGRFFKDWCEKDVRSWIRRDRNHPSLLLWSIGNEIYDTHADAHGQEITLRLKAAVEKHDPGYNARVTIGSNYMPWENAQKCADIVKMAGYNYGERCYEEHHRKHPDWVMYGSETASVVQSRGIYHFPLKQSILSEEDEQCSSLGNSNTSWGAKCWEKCITDDRDPEYILGQFIWTGFDYIGEPTPYQTKNSYFGQIDTAGFPKDSYYVFQAEWTEAAKAPMVHLFPYWDFNPGQLMDLRACTNAPAVELFVNGKSRGKQYIDHKRGLALLGEWQVPYEPGEIMAVAFDETGREIARDCHRSFGDSKALVLTAEKTDLLCDTKDMCFVTVSTVDEQGNPVENATDYVKAELTGPGRILGMDNGDSTDYDDYKTTVRKLFSGKLLIVVGTGGVAGKITLSVSGRGLEPARLEIMVSDKSCSTGTEKPGCGCGETAGFLEDCLLLKNPELPERIPVRKVELTAEGQKFSADQTEIIVKARLYPKHTTDSILTWKVVNAAGVEINYAKVQVLETKEYEQWAKVTALGDGEFYVRCQAGTGKKTDVISQLEFTADGFGKACLEPYAFLSAGLFTDTVGEIGTGNEKGIATQRLAESGVVFENVDFGDYGSDEFTIWIFALDGEPYPIDVWLGKPYQEGSEILERVVYKKPSIWNTYQEETFKLPKRIKGLATIAFTLQNKVHIKGFCFKRKEKAFEKLYGVDADGVYGDSFRRDGVQITGIGNNVTVLYDHMDFGTKGAGQVTLWGRTPLKGNTIHILFTAEDGSRYNRMAEFAGSSEAVTSQTFSIEKLYGAGRVELVFLPGSDFDLEAIQFTC